MRQHRRHPPRFDRERPVSHGIDPAVERIEATVGHARPDHLFGQTEIVELPSSYDPVLPPREARHSLIKNLRVYFPLLSNGKSTRVFHGADAGKEMRTGGAQIVPTSRRKSAPARRYRL
jgi:hypothetical protein